MYKQGPSITNKLSFAALIFFIFLFGHVDAQQDAFPGAEGFGRYASGGRGGDVYHVTKLTDWGEGTLRYGVGTASGPRTIVFDISGTILLSRQLKIDKSNITIAGQTAPGDGITLAGHDLVVSADHIIVRYIRVRLGDQSGSDSDAISISGGSNIIFDHVTASWSIDETFSFQSADIDSLTVQWCMVTESLRDSHHAKGKHGYGGIVGGLRQSVHHNLYAHHSSRSPKVSGRRHCEVDFRNNVLYNWGYNNCYDGTKSYMNWANNYYKPGPGTNSGVVARIFELSDAPVDPENEGWEISNTYTTSLYADGNYVLGNASVTADNWAGGIDYSKGANETEHRMEAPHDFPSITEQSAEEAYPLVLAGAGASKVRDAIDLRIINEVTSGTTTYSGSKTGTPGIIDSQNDVGGLPVLSTLPSPVDTDQDGMPDMWENENGLDPENPDDRNYDGNSDGYTNLEEYLHAVISLDPIDGISSYERSKEIRCYPNPVNDTFTIDTTPFGDSTVEIFNAGGQKVHEFSVSNSLFSVNSKQFNPGVYFIKLRDQDNSVYSQKIMIE